MKQKASAASATVLSAHGLPPAAGPHQLVVVLTWELRRLVASRPSWIIAGVTYAVFAALMLLLWGHDNPYMLSTPHGVVAVHDPATSVWGLIVTYPQSPGMFFGLLLPFVAADGVARDLRRRTHELLMSTSVSSWAYVLGRYLAGLVFSLVLACAMLVALVAVTALLHVANAAVFPPVVLSSALAFWALVVLPPVLLLGGLSFALGALLPRRANLVKLGVLLAWFACGASLWYLLNPDYRNPHAQASAYVVWDPTSIAPTFPLQQQFKYRLLTAAQTMDSHALRHFGRALQQSMPDLSSWIGPHLVWAAVGLGFAVGAALVFRRFRGALG
ncbi:MAG TPA: ABC transporter permease [Ktedonobacterales bacterium]|nr:ABC transporter permease [Ktedonobacterales bacterium]